MTSEQSTPSRSNRCPAWLRYWTPCDEHAHGSVELIDAAIRAWRYEDSHSGRAPARGYSGTAKTNWDNHACLETMRGIIRGCDDCRCQAASIAAQSALDDARRTLKPTYTGRWYGEGGLGRMLEDPAIMSWYRNIGAATYVPAA